MMVHCRGLSVWVCSQHAHARIERVRKRAICSFSWLQASAENFPSSPPLPAPTSCLHYSRVFRATPVTVGKQAASGNPAEYGGASQPVLPRGRPPLVRSAERGVGGSGIAPGEALGRRKSALGSAPWSALGWNRTGCSAPWRIEDPGKTKLTASLVINVN